MFTERRSVRCSAEIKNNQRRQRFMLLTIGYHKPNDAGSGEKRQYSVVDIFNHLKKQKESVNY